MREPSGKLAILIAVIGLLLAVLSISSVVPRIRLVEALSLFATAFGAGASFAVSMTSRRTSR